MPKHSHIDWDYDDAGDLAADLRELVAVSDGELQRARKLISHADKTISQYTKAWREAFDDFQANKTLVNRLRLTQAKSALIEAQDRELAPVIDWFDTHAPSAYQWFKKRMFVAGQKQRADRTLYGWFVGKGHNGKLWFDSLVELAKRLKSYTDGVQRDSLDVTVGCASNRVNAAMDRIIARPHYNGDAYKVTATEALSVYAESLGARYLPDRVADSNGGNLTEAQSYAGILSVAEDGRSFRFKRVGKEESIVADAGFSDELPDGTTKGTHVKVAIVLHRLKQLELAHPDETIRYDFIDDDADNHYIPAIYAAVKQKVDAGEFKNIQVRLFKSDYFAYIMGQDKAIEHFMCCHHTITGQNYEMLCRREEQTELESVASDMLGAVVLASRAPQEEPASTLTAYRKLRDRDPETIQALVAKELAEQVVHDVVHAAIVGAAKEAAANAAGDSQVAAARGVRKGSKPS